MNSYEQIVQSIIGNVTSSLLIGILKLIGNRFQKINTSINDRLFYDDWVEAIIIIKKVGKQAKRGSNGCIKRSAGGGIKPKEEKERSGFGVV